MMDTARQVLIAKGLIQQIEDSIEATSFNAKVCKRAEDDKGQDAAKTQLSELMKKLEAANAIVAEMEKEGA